MIYNCKCIDSNGNIIKTKIDVLDENNIKLALKEKGLKIISYSKINFFERKKHEFMRTKLSTKELERFCDKMYFIFDSGTSILEGFDIILKQEKLNKKNKLLFEDLYKGIKSGKSLSETMQNNCNKTFPDLLVNSIKSGEITGNLPDIFKNMSDYYKKQSFIKEKISGAFIQPLVTIIASLGLILLFILSILPQLIKTLELKKDNLPSFTKFMIDFTNVISEYYMYFIIGIIFIILSISWLYHTKKIKLLMHKLYLKMPMIKNIILDLETYRTVVLLFLFSKAQVPILDSFKAINKTLKNEVAKICVESAIKDILKGNSIYESLQKVKFYKEDFLEYLKIGENTGEMEKMLEKLQNNYSVELESKMQKYIKIIENFIGFSTGIIIVLLILSVAIPLFSMVNYVQF